MLLRRFEFDRDLIGPRASGQESAGVFAAKPTAQTITIAADPLVDAFSDPNHPRQPEEKRHRNERRHAQTDETEATSTAVDAARRGDAVNGFEQVIAGYAWGDFGSAWMRDREQFDGVTPVEPRKQLHLKRAQGALGIIKNRVALAERGCRRLQSIVHGHVRET
jgi:hypothetical protein